jgi:hypothetical protein
VQPRVQRECQLRFSKRLAFAISLIRGLSRISVSIPWSPESDRRLRRRRIGACPSELITLYMCPAAVLTRRADRRTRRRHPPLQSTRTKEGKRPWTGRARNQRSVETAQNGLGANRALLIAHSSTIARRGAVAAQTRQHASFSRICTGFQQFVWYTLTIKTSFERCCACTTVLSWGQIAPHECGLAVHGKSDLINAIHTCIPINDSDG